MIRSKFKIHEVLLIAAMVLLALGIWRYQHSAEGPVAPTSAEGLNYLPSGTFLKGMALGYDEALADLLWVRTIGYFGEHLKTDRQFIWLKHMLGLIIELDPRYESPYEFAAVILPAELDDADTAIDLLHQGVDNIPKHNPRYWLQPFYLGFSYLIYKNEPLQAARYFEIASNFPQSPKYLPLLVTRIYASENRPEIGYATIQSLLEDTDNEALQESRTRDSLIKRQKELVVAFHIQMLEKAVQEYTQLFGRPPAQLQDLVDTLIVPFIPSEPFGGYYHLSFKGDQVLSSLTEGKFRVYGDRRQQLSILKPKK